MKTPLHCSFCFESEETRDHIVVGDMESGLCICDVCVDICAKVIGEQQEANAIAAAKIKRAESTATSSAHGNKL